MKWLNWYCPQCGDGHQYNDLLLPMPDYTRAAGLCGMCLVQAGRLKKGVLIGTDAYPLVEAKMISEFRIGDKVTVVASGWPGEIIAIDRDGHPGKSHAVGYSVKFSDEDERWLRPADLVPLADHLSAATPVGHPEFYKIVEEMKALHEKKAKDYGLGKDVLANCRGSEDFGIPGWIGVVMRMNDKMTRLKAFAQKGSLANESVEDSLIDLANYAVLALILYREKAAGRVNIDDLVKSTLDALGQVNFREIATDLQDHKVMSDTLKKEAAK